LVTLLIVFFKDNMKIFYFSLIFFFSFSLVSANTFDQERGFDGFGAPPDMYRPYIPGVGTPGTDAYRNSQDATWALYRSGYLEQYHPNLIPSYLRPSQPVTPSRQESDAAYYEDLRRSQQLFMQRPNTWSSQNNIDPDGHVNFPNFSGVATNVDSGGSATVIWPDNPQLPDDFNVRDYIGLQSTSGQNIPGPSGNISANDPLGGISANDPLGGISANDPLGGISANDPSDTPGGGVLRLQNPIKANTFPQFLQAIIAIVVQVGIPVVVLGIMYAGFLFVTARGNSEQLNTAKQALLYSLIGAGIVLGAFVISTAIQGTIDQLGR